MPMEADPAVMKGSFHHLQSRVRFRFLRVTEFLQFPRQVIQSQVDVAMDGRFPA
jgi:hypothetical protein